jgi:methylenetetrahydrofolate dehydrogenase (NADP+)/methenyltetrahydrofolate cyclohydrolase
MIVMDGKALAQRVRENLTVRVSEWNKGHAPPKLCVLRVGDNPASEVYVRNKARSCVEVGMLSEVLHRPQMSEAEVLAQVIAWNEDPAVTGILVQLPLLPGIDERKILECVAPGKDVDGFHPVNVGRLALGLDAIAPCTPTGVMRLIAEVERDIAGAHAVVIGRSNIVGKPMAQMLLTASATVTICHSKTRDLPALVREADIVVAAIGKAEFVRGDWIKPGAIVVDVGMNRKDGKLCGDVEYAAAAERARAITPVPGGVGPMTIAMLLENTFRCAQLARND